MSTRTVSTQIAPTQAVSDRSTSVRSPLAQRSVLEKPCLNRRQFATAVSLAGLAGVGGPPAWALLADSQRHSQAADLGQLKIAPFRFDVTPPMGHSMCGGWIKPAEAVDDPLEAIGYVLLGCGQPIVFCAVDWTGLLNSAHVRWRQALAAAVGTTPDRVALHCVHQHNAPFACLESQAIVQAEGDLPDIVDLDFYQQCLQRAAEAASQALAGARPITHIATQQSPVDQVASNRRVFRDAAGHVLAMRGSSCRDERLRSLPEGTIDPLARSLVFYDHDQPVVASHYYTTHPMSYYGDGRVSSDFAGLARKRLQAEMPDCTQLYFTGCAGNIAAGKYNDGSPEMRPVLTDRVYAALAENMSQLQPVAIERLSWNSVDVLPLANESLSAEALQRQISDPTQAIVQRNRPAYQLGYLKRLEAKIPITISHLRVNDSGLLHLPGEAFVQYQLAAAELFPGTFLATAAYGDGGPWYIPVEEEFPHGGYEVEMCFSAPPIDQTLREAIARLLVT